MPDNTDAIPAAGPLCEQFFKLSNTARRKIPPSFKDDILPKMLRPYGVELRLATREDLNQVLPLKDLICLLQGAEELLCPKAEKTCRFDFIDEGEPRKFVQYLQETASTLGFAFDVRRQA